MIPVKIAIIDLIGLTYDGTTLATYGLGGSESAIIYIAQELAAVGCDVTVFNNCADSRAQPGVYEGVKYVDVNDLIHSNTYTCDVMIASRTIMPFVDSKHWKDFNYPCKAFTAMKQSAKLKVLWLHDTFCSGDHLVEECFNNGDIDEMFTLSDFHTSYVLNCDHGGRRRNWEVLKDKMFMTRNGAKKWIKEIDVRTKDKNLFVYNSSITKGMIPLVERIWPEVKRRIPQAKLKIIGGYYRFRDGAAPDAQEETFHKMVALPEYKKLDIEFLGIIPQKQIGEILTEASFMIYPGAFPETFGISALEALLHNTPLITTRFGALEETAVDLACYKIDYAIEPNGLYPGINTLTQVKKFVDLVVYAYTTPYLHMQKMQYCSIVHDIAGWDGVALQWKQHFYKKLGLHLPVEEYRAVNKLNQRLHKVFGRRISNPEEWSAIPSNPQQHITLVTPFFNGAQYLEKCILSVASQDYDNYHMILIDDASTDGGFDVAKRVIESLPENVQKHFILKRNTTNQGAVFNAVSVMRELESEDIILMLDGDDSLSNDNSILQMYNTLYTGEVEFTYGSCWSVVDNIPLVAQPYPQQVREAKEYRNYRFAWNMPYTHLRTFKQRLIAGLPDSVFQDKEGHWLKAGGDTAIFYNTIERADPNKIHVVTDIIYQYNDASPLNDYKVNGAEQTKNANYVLGGGTTENPKFSVVVPTMWRHEPFLTFLQELVSCPFVGEVLIINNDVTQTPLNKILKHYKVRVLNQEKNIYVNPAWNLGAKESRNRRLCFLNDDIQFDLQLFEKINALYAHEFGVAGFCPGDPEWPDQPAYTNGAIDVVPWTGQAIHGFGTLWFIDKKNWEPIPAPLKVYYGDNFVFDRALKLKKTNYLICNMNVVVQYATTVKNIPRQADIFNEEKTLYKILSKNILDPSILDFMIPLVPNTPNAPAIVALPDPPVATLVKYNKDISAINKQILLAIPTNKYIEAETFKSIYDLDIPAGYEVRFECFYGYNIEQIRNLISSWVVNGNFEYLFSVDSDVVLPSDTLTKLIAADKDIVSGLYIQRKPGVENIELYRNKEGAYLNIPMSELEPLGLHQIDACGFGCVLVKKKVLCDVGYPQFEYHMNRDLTIRESEDVDFCRKASNKGFAVWADSTILCDHKGSRIFRPTVSSHPKQESVLRQRLRLNSSQIMIPTPHCDYLVTLRDKYGVNPKVIFDIGACVLHWTNIAQVVWPREKTEYILFEAMHHTDFLYEEGGYRYHCGVLSHTDNKEIDFWENPEHPGGNSYYLQNVLVNPESEHYFNDTHRRKRKTHTLDTIVRERGFPLPDLIKMDIQGAEMDVLKGATHSLSQCTDLILECQHTEYNTGAPMAKEVIAYLNSVGFIIVGDAFHKTPYDGDYHFRRK